MGARVVRMFRNFNLENRAHREVSKAKPTPAPRHATPTNITEPAQEVTAAIHKKNEPLLSLLKSVYVESTDPVAKPTTAVAKAKEEVERRPLKFSLPGDPYGICDITDVPKGKLSLVEALTALNSHKRSPDSWTAEKLAEEYSLDLKDTLALLEFFIPFDVKIIPPKEEGVNQIKDS
ncbi:NADH dehydrogenase [ubiquinone] 1 alpha subcomplex assembly factor 4 [Chanos chanos]|uniref:NADH dehydrogenase [ubiquinone] 1 alpha subcomplex assembly factor 4 n=1 Tax=Chanos chanos TaxID=29144 RepID=A0A6J2VZA1_CHACN|nr:NADH dehydrogenase [ubiquinone] 1 alpha subcomplex assembly factor 4 [Chanos chanos]